MAAYHFPRGTPFHARMNAAESGCWEWQGARNARGYGCYYPAMGVKFLAHRYAYQQAFGAIPEDLEVCHRCDNPPCCNPDHLFLGTHVDNMADMVAKDRSSKKALRGTEHPSARFSADEVRTIRTRVAAGETRTAIASELGVNLSTISLITRRKHYQEVD